MVDQFLVGIVVVFHNVLPVGEIKEIVSLVDHLVEVVIRVAAVGHRSTEIILRIYHVLVARLVIFVVVLCVRLGKLFIECIPLVSATDDVVPLIDRLVSIGVEETGVPLSGTVLGQILDLGKALEGDMRLSEMICDHSELELKIIIIIRRINSI